MVPASRPLMTLTDTARPDYVTPPLVAGEPAGAGGLRGGDGRAPGRPRTACCEMDVPLEAALYLLPNAKALRFHESG